MNVSIRISLLVTLVLFSGCVITEVGVTNPIPKMSRIAIVPFTNLSSERVVNGRRIADLYFSELQKIPGFQVLPVGVTESAIQDHDLSIEKPSDIIELADILDVDAVVFGAVTEYSAYYPPRLGLQVSWYSVEEHQFLPGMPIDPTLRGLQKEAIHESRSWLQNRKRTRRERQLRHRDDGCLDCGPMEPTPASFSPVQDDVAIRGQSPVSLRAMTSYRSGKNLSGEQIPVSEQSIPSAPWDDALKQAMFQGKTNDSTSVPPLPGGRDEGGAFLPAPAPIELPSAPSPIESSPSSDGTDSGGTGQSTKQQKDPFEPQPIMSYTRIFDGSDDKLVATLRDYVELSGDQRSGGWEGYLHRSDDFLRFCTHRMIVEMLQLHGGETHRRTVMTRRKLK